MNRRQKIIVSVTGIFIVLLALVGLTYGYFLTRIQGNTNSKSITVTTADLKLTYGDGNEKVITGDKIMPNTVIGEKDFTVTNEGDSSSYVVVIDGDSDDENGITPINVRYATNGTTRDGVTYSKDTPAEFKSNDFVYTLTCKSVNATTGVETGTCNGQSLETSFPMNGAVIIGNNIAENIRHEYVLKVTYLETNEDQTDDMNKTFDARINIADIKALNPYNGNEDSLAYNIIENAKIGKSGAKLLAQGPTAITEKSSENWEEGNVQLVEIPNISVPGQYVIFENGENDFSISGGCEVVNGKTITDQATGNRYKIVKCENGNAYYEVKREQVLSVSQDNFGTSYYYRGAVTNNYVNFAKKCWRIVRINGDGTIKLVLDDENVLCDANDYTGKYYIATGDFGYESFTNGDITLKKANYLNPKDNPEQSMVNILKNFQSEISSYLGNLSSGNWCLNDIAYLGNGEILDSNKKYTDLNNDGVLNFNDDFYYDTYMRYNNGNKAATLLCRGRILNKFDDNNNGIIESSDSDMFVGSLTADEFVYAGAPLEGSGDMNRTFYLYRHKYNQDIQMSLSLGSFRAGYGFKDSIYGLSPYGQISNTGTSAPQIRPAVNLKNNIEITKGDGTQGNPYVIGS